MRWKLHSLLWFQDQSSHKAGITLYIYWPLFLTRERCYLHYSHSTHLTALLVRCKFSANLQILSPSPSLRSCLHWCTYKKISYLLSAFRLWLSLSVALCETDSLFPFYLITDLLDSFSCQECLYMIWVIRNACSIPAMFSTAQLTFSYLLPLIAWFFTIHTPFTNWVSFPWLTAQKYGWLIQNALDVHTCLASPSLESQSHTPAVAAAKKMVCFHSFMRLGEIADCWYWDFSEPPSGPSKALLCGVVFLYPLFFFRTWKSSSIRSHSA